MSLLSVGQWFVRPTRSVVLFCCTFSMMLAGCSPTTEETVAETGNARSSTGASDIAEEKDEPSRPRISAQALRNAALEGRLSVVQGAIEDGAEVDAADPVQKQTPLILAAFNGHTETVKYLLDQGAEIEARDSEGKTALIHACTGPFLETVKLLLDSGAEINARDSTEAYTPLMMAAGTGQEDVLQYLLSQGADKDLRDDDDERAIDHAKARGNFNLVSILAALDSADEEPAESTAEDSTEASDATELDGSKPESESP